MNREDNMRAKEVADRLRPHVTSAFSPLGVEHLDQDYRAGEYGMVLEYCLYVADRDDIDLPLEDVRAAGEILAIPGMLPPRTDFDAVKGFLSRLSGAAA